MVGFCDLVWVGIAPVSKKNADKSFLTNKIVFDPKTVTSKLIRIGQKIQNCSLDQERFDDNWWYFADYLLFK